MAEVVYVLCAATSAVCAALLLRSYFQNKTRLLLWSSVCFVGLAVNNVLLFLDVVVWPHYDLGLLRNAAALIAMGALLYGLIWETT